MKKNKDLLLKELSSKGFIYYPSMKRFMLKNESERISAVTVVEMNDDNCRVFHDESLKGSDMKNSVKDLHLNYDINEIVRYIDSLLFNSNKTAAMAA